MKKQITTKNTKEEKKHEELKTLSLSPSPAVHRTHIVPVFFRECGASVVAFVVEAL
jgi:hypothetical protein